MRPPTTKLAIAASLGVLFFLQPALAQDGSLLTTLENEVADAAQGWETTVMQAARSLFWILAGIEVGIAAVWLALGAASLDTWFAELVRRIMFIGLFVFILEQGPDFARAMVDSLFQIGAGGGSASPANVFNAGLQVASQMSEKAQFGLFEDNALAIAAVFAMVIVVIAFSLVAAIFVAVMAEMYVGLLAGMIMLGLGGSSFTKDFAVRYLVYAFSVGMKLMALVMIARIGSEVLINLANSPSGADEFLSTLAIGGISRATIRPKLIVTPRSTIPPRTTETPPAQRSTGNARSPCRLRPTQSFAAPDAIKSAPRRYCNMRPSPNGPNRRDRPRKMPASASSPAPIIVGTLGAL